MSSRNLQLCPFTGLFCPFWVMPHACPYFLEKALTTLKRELHWRCSSVIFSKVYFQNSFLAERIWTTAPFGRMVRHFLRVSFHIHLVYLQQIHAIVLIFFAVVYDNIWAKRWKERRLALIMPRRLK